MYRCFTRTFWKRTTDPKWPNGLEPNLGKRTTIATAATEEEARSICKVYNSTHEPGKLSKKCEYERVNR
jgi:hypothetical protein